MQHERDAGRGEVASLAGNLFGEFLGELAEDLREIDAGFLEDAAFGQNARPSPAAAFALPGILAEWPVPSSCSIAAQMRSCRSRK